MKFTLLIMIFCWSSLAHAQITNESKLGIASANGNTKTQTYHFKQANDYKWNKKHYVLNPAI